MGTANRPVACRHLKDVRCRRTLVSGDVYEIYGCGHQAHNDTTLEYCDTCLDYDPRQSSFGERSTSVGSSQPQYPPPPADDAPYKKKRDWRQLMRSHRSDHRRHILDSDPTVCTDRAQRQGGLASLYYGADIYLLLGGPSSAQLDLTKLNRRGVISMAVNNAALTHRTNMFICGDPPKKFHDAIWRDPGIMCFVPEAKLWNEIYEKKPNGEVRSAQEQVKYQPSVVGYKRNTFFNPQTFLSEPTVNFGNSRKSDNDWEPVLSTMFSAIKMCYWLGAFRVYLLGCDWNWDYSKQPYSFEMTRGVNVYASNNNSYRKMTPMWRALKPYFDNAGFEIYNCNVRSKLKVFPFRSFDDAIKMTTAEIPKDLTAYSWYGKDHDEGQDEKPFGESDS